MPLCSFSILRNLLMSVLLFNICPPGNRNYYTSAVPLHSLRESKTEEKNSNYDQAAPLKQQGKGLPLKALFNDDVPNIPSPSNVQLSFLNISSVLISWSYPGADRAYFVVQRSYDGDAYKNVSGPLTATQFVYSGMKFSAYYQFRVIAYVGGEASPPTETGYFVNGITAPPGPPLNVVATVMSYDVINLQWDAPPTPSPVLYLVEWGTNETHLNQEKTIAQSTHVSFPSLQLNTTYYYRVRAEVNSWTSVASPLVTATTPPPNLPALTVQANASDRWVLIVWSDPPDDRYPKTITSYKILVNSNKAALDSHKLNDSNMFISVSPTLHSFNLTGLSPGGMLTVCVAYTSSDFQSEMSRPLQLETLEDVVCGSCDPLSSTQLRIAYKVLTSLNKTRTISVLESGVPLAQFRTQDISGVTIVSDLRPWTGHSLTVALETTSGERQSDLCPLLYCWTKEAAPSEPPTNIRATALSSHSIQLSWSQPHSNALNGIITKYSVGYQCTPRYTGQDCSTRQFDVTANKPDNISAIIDYLTPFTIYSVVISASTKVGRGPLSFPLTLATKEDAPTTSPVVTTVTNITATSFYISWRPPTRETQNGEIISYRLSLITVPNNCNDINKGKFQKGGNIVVQNATRTKFSDLLAATTYAVIVSASTSAGESPFSEPVCVSTLPSVNTLVLDLNFTAEAIPTSIVEDVCFNLTFGWDWPLLLQSARGVSLVTWSVFIHYNNNIMSNSSQTASVFVGKDVLVTMVTFSKFNHSWSLVGGTNSTFWLEINGLLSNNSSVQIQTHQKLIYLPTCSSSLNNWILITSVCVVAVLGCASLLCLTTCCGYLKWKKRRQVVSQGGYVMDNFMPPDLEENDYLLDPSLRISDGQNSIENSRTSSESLYEDDSSSLSRASDSDSELLNLGTDDDNSSPYPKTTTLRLPPANGMSDSPLKPRDSALALDSLEAECRPQALPLAPRQNPDGCSLSSTNSSESTALMENED